MGAIARFRAALPATRMKVAATALLGVPAVLLIAVALGEMAGGEPSGVQHLPEGGLLLLVAVAGWKYPRAAGVFLVVAGLVLLVGWLLLLALSENGPEGAEIWPVVAAGLVLFAPPILAGWLLMRAGGYRGGAFLVR